MIQLSVYLIVGFFISVFDNHPDNFFHFVVGFSALIRSFDLKPKIDIMYPYSEAYLNAKNDDITKRWYISFMVYDVQQGKKIRKWDYSVNTYATVRERKKYAQKQIKSINTLLEQGFHIDSSKIEDATTMTVEEGVRNSLSAASVSHASYLSYSSDVNRFLKWAEKLQFNNLPIQFFDVKKAYKYRDHLVREGKSGVTINKDIDVLKRMWNALLKRNPELGKNPWKIDREKEIITNRNIAFTWGEVKQLSDLLSKADRELWYFCKIIYHTLARPTEIRQLQVHNIHLSKRKIYLDAWKSKNKKERWIGIHDSLIETLIDLISNKRGSDFLFPGVNKDKPVSKNRMNDRQRPFLQQLGLSDGDHTLYSWKHTGVVEAYLAGVDIKSIQLQCGHSSILETDKYLKSLGLYDNHEIIIKQPALPL